MQTQTDTDADADADADTDTDAYTDGSNHVIVCVGSILRQKASATLLAAAGKCLTESGLKAISHMFKASTRAFQFIRLA